jgi:cell wall-associated NlpC family hydrolase
MPSIVSPRFHTLLTKSLVLLVAIFVLAAVPKAHAQRYRRYLPPSAAIALQPFSLDNARPISVRRSVDVAYYSPRAIRRAAAASSDNDEDESSARSAPIESSGSHPVVGGSRAVLRNGVAYAPANAPDRVKSAIWAVNTIRRKPYVWGGGHGSFSDRGYDCSGTVSFALHNAGLLSSPLPSSDLMRYGERGRGRWMTIYSRHGHTFAVIAGLRLDTTDFRYGGDVGPRWHTDFRSTSGFVATHPVGL